MTPVERKTYVLVHGAYHGAWCWKDVAAPLRALGHTVYTPTLTGLGERSHLLSFMPTGDTFIEDVAQVIRYEDLKGVILVGHSFAGSVVSGLADLGLHRVSRRVATYAASASGTRLAVKCCNEYAKHF